MRRIIPIFVLLLLIPLISAATLKGSIYNTQLEQETDVLIEVNSIPEQRLLSKDGNYQFELPLGSYTLTAMKSGITTTETVSIIKEGTFVVDLFLLPDLQDEDTLWQETEEELTPENVLTERDWLYGSFGIILLIVILAIFLYKSKYSPLRRYLNKLPHKITEEITIPEKIVTKLDNPGDLQETIEIIKKHDGRITQKDLRQEMVHFSEAKISLIITDLEHQGRVEKIKKGRGNVILLKTKP